MGIFYITNFNANQSYLSKVEGPDLKLNNSQTLYGNSWENPI